MKPILIITGVVLITFFIAWLVYNKRLQIITNIYKEIAERFLPNPATTPMLKLAIYPKQLLILELCRQVSWIKST